ncbi:MAG: hypothetical protein R2741_11425 [Methanolobus sp.]
MAKVIYYPLSNVKKDTNIIDKKTHNGILTKAQMLVGLCEKKMSGFVIAAVKRTVYHLCTCDTSHHVKQSLVTSMYR